MGKKKISKKQLRKVVKAKRALGTTYELITRTKIVLILSGVIFWLVILFSLLKCSGNE